MHQQIKSISVLFMLSILVCASGEATIIELGELQEDTLHISSNMKLGGVDKPIQLVYSTFLGGVGNDKGKELACDSKNNVYVLGSTYGSGFPIYDGYNDTYGGSEDAVLSSFDEDGNLRWSTYLGGEDAEYAQDIAIDSSDNIYVTGSTYSSDFPTKDAYQESSGGISDIFLTSFSPNGSMRWSTYLGGDYTDDAEGISVDSNDLIYIAGSTSSPNFPTKNPYQASNNGSSDVFISAFYPNGSLEWSSYYGGNMPDKAMDISFDHNGNMYLTGYTKSDNFPMLNAYDNTRSSSTSPDIFISSFSPQRYLRWSTYFHGQGEDIAYGIAFDSSNNLYLTGYTNSTDFPTILAYQSVYGGTNADAFVSSFTPTGTIRWSTFLGGENSEYAFDIGVDANDFIYVTGLTRSGNFPVVDAIQEKMSTSTFNEEMFISSFAANGSLHWSTYLGDQSNNHDQAWGIHMFDHGFLLTGRGSWGFPTYKAYQEEPGGYYDLVVLKFGFDTDRDGIHDQYEMDHGLAPSTRDGEDDLDGDGMSNLYEYLNDLDIQSNDANLDYDDDGMPNRYEYEHDLRANYNDADEDLDGDDIPNWYECEHGLRANVDDANEDSDGDGMPNLFEYENKLKAGTDDARLDYDNDTISNLYEYQNGLDVTVNDAEDDTDQDGMPNLYEYRNGLLAGTDDAEDDLDGDGMPNLFEYENGLKVSVDDADADLDNDGIPNLVEYLNHLNVTVQDSNLDFDGDGMPNIYEYKNGLNIVVDDADLDPDGDGFTNLEEYLRGSDPHKFDFTLENSYQYLITLVVVIAVSALLIRRYRKRLGDDWIYYEE